MTFHPTPPASQTVTVTGTLFHDPGSWGTDRALRRSAIVSLFVREPPTGPGQSVEHPLGFQIVDGGGKFSIDASGMSIPSTAIDIEEFLRVQYLPTGDIQEITLDNVPWGFGAPTMDLGKLRFNWTPPEPVLAEVDGKWFDDTKSLADRLANALMDAQPKPYSARTNKIVLLWEPTESDDYTRVQNSFKSLQQIDIHRDFPDRLVQEVEKIPQLRTKMTKWISDALLNYLFKISTLRQYQIERGNTLDKLIRAINSALGWRIDQAVFDPMPDMAASCALIYIAGRMAKDQGSMSQLRYVTRSVSWATLNGINTIEMSVGR